MNSAIKSIVAFVEGKISSAKFEKRLYEDKELEEVLSSIHNIPSYASPSKHLYDHVFYNRDTGSFTTLEQSG